MEINHFTIHKVIINEGLVETLPNPPEKTDFERYITSVIKEIADEEKGEKFKIRDIHTQVINIVHKNILEGVNNDQQSIADRLLQKEIEAQQNVQKLNIAIQSGLLIQANIIHGGCRKYVICKAENSRYINGRNYKGDDGYPEKKKIIKSFIVVFNDDDSIKEISITDSNSSMTKYWWDDFLELDKFHDDVYNTTTAFNGVDRILSQIKGKHPADHVHLRNATIKAFRTEGDFQFDTFVESLYRRYTPVDPDLNMNELADKINKLPEKLNFDRRFDTVTTEIKARLKSIINLTENIDLLIKQDIDIDHIITAFKVDNVKYIRIRTEKGYNTFTKEND